MRKLGFIGIMVFIFLGSFFMTLWLTEFDQSSGVEGLSRRRIVDLSALIEAGVAAGLHRSWTIKGNVDTITRIDDREVRMSGWLVDPESNGEPLTVLVFVGGNKIAVTQTFGERPDVIKALGLTSVSATNVGFIINFACRSGDQPISVGLGSNKQYFMLSSPACP